MLGKDRARKLAKLKTPKGRCDQDLILLDSRPLVGEGLAQGIVKEVFFAAEGEFNEIVRAEKLGIPVTPAQPEILAKLADVKTQAGLVALAACPPYVDLRAALESAPEFLLFLDQIADPGNLGSIARSAAAFGCDLVVLSPDCCDPFSSKSLRASAGALLRLPLAEGFPQPEMPWPKLHRAVAKGGEDFRQFHSHEPRGLWVGNEAHGPRAAATLLDVVDITIGMDQTTESLNVAAAAAILCHGMGKTI